jgi:DNA polymerase-3 subunit gamma/tau
MRWTTSPRLTLELALVRAALPETDPQPAALLARVERLERLAGLPQSESPGAESALGSAPVTRGVPSAKPRADVNDEGADAVAEEATVSPAREPEAEPASAADESRTREPEPRGDREAAGAGEGPHAPKAGVVDAEMLRRSWPEVLEALKSRRKMVLFASAQVATVGSFEGDTIELVFPPGREVGAAKVEERSADLVEVLQELFGITPTIRCTVRQGTAVEATDDEPPPSPEAAEALVRAQFGAEVIEEE